MTATSREHNEQFIRSFGTFADRDAVLALFRRYGLVMLTDEQLAEVVSDKVADCRRATRLHFRNRRINAAYYAGAQL
jgi:hypothetical protein